MKRTVSWLAGQYLDEGHLCVDIGPQGKMGVGDFDHWPPCQVSLPCYGASVARAGSWEPGELGVFWVVRAS